MQSVVFTFRGLWVWSFTLMLTYLKLTEETNLSWFWIALPAVARVLLIQGIALWRSYKSVTILNAEIGSQTNEGTGNYV